MKNATRAFTLVLIASLLGFVNCGGGGSKTSTTPSQPPVQAPTLASISVSPVDPSLPLGKTQQLTATGKYSDNSTKDLTSTATWKTSNSTVATVSAGGLLTTLKKGVVSITATSGSVSKTISVTVTDPVVASISLSPTSASLATGQSQQFAANAIYSDNSQRDVTALVAWTSGDTSIAEVNAAGLAIANKQGSTKIFAKLGDIIGTSDLTVTPAVLTQVDVTPDVASIPIGADVQLAATGTFSDQSTQDLVDVQWNSSDSAVAVVNANGLVQAVAAGTVTITAQVGTLSDTASVTVTPASLVSIAVTPAAPSMAKGTSQQFSAVGTFTDGSTQDITGSVTWASENTGTASVDSVGFVKALAEGTSVISATSGDKVGTATLAVTSAVIASIIITPGNSSTGIGGTQQFTASGVFTDASTQDLTTQVTWTSSNASVAVINSTGLANAVGKGTAAITAGFGEISGSTLFTVLDATLTAITVSPADPVVATHTKLRFTATGQFSDSSTRILTGVNWNSSKPKFASINGSGLLRSKRAGTAVIKASLNGKTGSTAVTITNDPITSVVVTPTVATIAVGGTQQFTATGYFADAGLPPQDLSASVYWRTSDFNTATINTSGVASGRKAGMANITATYGTIVSRPAVLNVE